jgi:signal transduction histidine kinase
VSADQFVNGFEALIRQSFVPILPPPDYVAPAGEPDPRPLTELTAMIERLANDPCRCMIPPNADAIFRIDLVRGSATAVDGAGRDHQVDPALITEVRKHADLLPGLGWRYGTLLLPGPNGPRFVLFSRRVGPGIDQRFGYGIAIPASNVADRVFAQAFRTIRLVPRHLLATVPANDQYLAIEVTTAAGDRLYQSNPPYPDGPAEGLVLPPLRGGLNVTVRLNPTLKDVLIPGGIPATVPVRELIMIGLALTLLLAIAAFGIRAVDLASLRADFTSSITHELRTPLTQIRLAAETVLLGRARDREAERRSLASIVAESERLQQLVDNLLHFSRAERQLARIHPEPVELSALIGDVAGGFAPVIADRRSTITVAIDSPIFARADRHALRQVMLNVLDNAVRYGPLDQSISITGARDGDGMVELRIEDQGPGIPVVDRGRVWEPFVRLDRDLATAGTGTGLGLAVVRELVQAQGGSCRIESAAGGGTAVVIRLPIATEPE